LHSIHKPEKPFGETWVTLSPTRGLAKLFDRLTLARAHADFVSRVSGVAAKRSQSSKAGVPSCRPFLIHFS
jgi:hypothetical protein